MKKIVWSASLLLLAVPAMAQSSGAAAVNPLTTLAHPRSGHVVTPLVSIPRTGDAGKFMHTKYRIFVPAGPNAEAMGIAMAATSGATTPLPGYYYETPASLACLYGLAPFTQGCNPGLVTQNATGGAQSIAIVDAYDYPTALGDLQAYSKQFGLPVPTSSTFHVVYAGGSNPGYDPACVQSGGWNCWASESALDIEMAHAMAPGATIYLVEANSNSDADLFQAVQVASNLVVCGQSASCPSGSQGAGEVSMSWGGGEGSDETSYDAYFNVPRVVFFAASGDSWGVEYPSASPDVVAVGGTTISRSLASTTFLNAQAEIAWEDGGGGLSLYESQPAYQQHVAALHGIANRAVPDVAAVANPNTGVWVYNSFATDDIGDDCIPSGGNWCIFGGTSVATPLTAAVVNSTGRFAASTAAQLRVIYKQHSLLSLRDIQYGSCGFYQGWFAVAGWDPCTGNGALVSNTAAPLP